MDSLNLNTDGQAELYERACGRMAQLLPGWSDAIPSDPAVALLELVSYLSYVQNREIGAIRARHYLAYLNLLGRAPRQLAPARMRAVPVGCAKPWPGMRFEIDGVPFEVDGAAYTGPCRVEDVSLEQGGRRSALREDAPLAFTPEAPAVLSITLSAPLPPDVPVQLWLELQPEPGRVAPEELTAPPVRLAAQIGTGGARRSVPCRDGTCGLLRSGYVEFTPSIPFDTLCLRVESEIEGEPRISAAALYPAAVEQRRTRSRCLDLEAPFRLPPDWGENRVLRFFLPQDGGWREEKSLFSRGGLVEGLSGQAPEIVRVVASEPDFRALYPLRELPGETIRLEEDGILPDSLRLMVEEDGLWYDCPVCRPAAAADPVAVGAAVHLAEPVPDDRRTAGGAGPPLLPDGGDPPDPVQRPGVGVLPAGRSLPAHGRGDGPAGLWRGAVLHHAFLRPERRPRGRNCARAGAAGPVRLRAPHPGGRHPAGCGRAALSGAVPGNRALGGA